jgi:hypothetical protein
LILEIGKALDGRTDSNIIILYRAINQVISLAFEMYLKPESRGRD